MIAKIWNKIVKSIKRIIKIIKIPEMVILPGNISFALILSIFPAIMILGFIISKFNLSTENVLNMIDLNIPKEIYDIIVKFLSSESNASMALVTLLIGLFFSSNGTKSIIIAANILYKTEEKNEIRKTVKSIFLVFLLMMLFSFTMFVLGLGPSILKAIVSLFKGDYDYIYNIFTIFKWPFSLLLIYFSVKIVYVIAPSTKIKSASVTKGAVFTTIGWSVATYIYSVYVSNFAKYDVFYGSLSSIIVLMIWVYILSNILVIGFGINADYYLQGKNESKVKSNN